MTAKQEREWAQDIIKRVSADSVDVGVLCYIEFLAIIKGFADDPKYYNKPFARKVTSLFENILWLREAQEGKITEEEFFKRLEAKGKAEAEKQWTDRLKRLNKKYKKKGKKKKN